MELSKEPMAIAGRNVEPVKVVAILLNPFVSVFLG